MLLHLGRHAQDDLTWPRVVQLLAGLVLNRIWVVRQPIHVGPHSLVLAARRLHLQL